jgi:hypothetical protein
MAYWNNRLLVSETTYVSDQTICGTYGGDVFDYTSESPLAVIGGYSIKEVMAAVRASTLRPRWRISVLSSDDRVLRYIPEEDILAGGSYSENYQSGQRRSLSFSVLDEDGKYSVGVNGVWFMSRFGLEMGIGMPDGGVAWVKRGVYIAQQPSQQHSSDRNIVQVACADKWALFSGASGRLESTYEIESGSKIIPIIKSIQSTDRESGVPFDVQPLIVHPSLMGAITQSKVTMNPGQTYADMLLELATQMSAEIFYNSVGQLTILPLSEASLDDSKASSWDFDEDRGEIDSLGFSFNSSDVFNRVIVIGSTASGSYHRAEASNDDPSSPTSVQRIGVRTASIINDANITTDYLAKERAQYELRKILLTRTSTSFNTSLNPFPALNGVITITSPYYRMVKERFVVQSISCSIDHSGSMTISASSVWNLPFLTRSDKGKAKADMATRA